MPESPLISVITPVYNSAAYVRQAIDSVFAQTIGRENIEHIIVDDGSTDNTADIVREYGNSVRFLQREHGGVSRARNAGIFAATGKYIAFLDSDDYWLPEFAERVLTRLSREEKIFVTVEGYVELPDGTRRALPFYRSRGYAPLFELDAEAQFQFDLEGNFISIFSVVPRHALLEAGGFNTRLRFGEDWDLWLRLLKNGYAARLVSEPLRVYRRHAASTTSRHTAERAQNLVFVLSQYKDSVSPYRWKTARANARKAAARELLDRLGVMPLRKAAP